MLQHQLHQSQTNQHRARQSSHQPPHFRAANSSTRKRTRYNFSGLPTNCFSTNNIITKNCAPTNCFSTNNIITKNCASKSTTCGSNGTAVFISSTATCHFARGVQSIKPDPTRCETDPAR